MTVSCPFDCPYLEEARLHDKPNPVNPDEFPNKDIRVSDQFLRDHGDLLEFLGQHLLSSAVATAGAIDYDVREALEALIRTYRTLESGVYYETHPSNPVAKEIYQRLQAGIVDFRRNETERGITRTRDLDVLGILAFLQRLEIDRNNQRKRGRAFLDFLRGQFPSLPAAQRPPGPSAGSLILP